MGAYECSYGRRSPLETTKAAECNPKLGFRPSNLSAGHLESRSMILYRLSSWPVWVAPTSGSPCRREADRVGIAILCSRCDWLALYVPLSQLVIHPMVWSFRKSFGAGPLRFTVSKSGLSTSVGGRHIRMGANSRSSWISMGVGGIRYRHVVPHSKAGSGNQPASAKTQVVEVEQGAHGPFQQLQSAGVVDLSETDSQGVLADLNERRRRVLPGWVLVFGAVLLLTLGVDYVPWNLVVLGGLIWWRVSSKRRATATLWYDLDDVARGNWETLRHSLLALKEAKRVWYVTASASVHDNRYHAGANQLLDRKIASLGKGVPSLIVTNTEPVQLKAGDTTMYFFPDRILLYRLGKIGGVGYDVLQIDASVSYFRETERVPKDATISDYTWQYVNRNGSADKRFANNRQIPICAYETIEFRADAGLSQHFQVSRQGLVQPLIAAVRQAARSATEFHPQSRSSPEPTRLAMAPPPLPSALKRSSVPTAVSPPLPPVKPVVSPPPPPPQRRPPPAPVAQPPSQLRPTAAVKPVEFPPQSPRPTAAPQPPAEPAPCLKWIEAGQPVEIGDITIPDGMLYWHESESDLGEPSALAVWKEVAKDAASSEEDLGYWPDYGSITPQQRRAYLEWMASGRRDENPARRSLGYVFLFFYGIERRLLADRDQNNAALFEELMAVYQHYQPAQRSHSLRSYFLQLLHYAGFLQGHAAYRTLWPRLLAIDGGGSDENALRLIAAQHYWANESLDWTVAMRIARRDENSRNSIVITRAGDQFVELFRHRYAESFGPGIMLQVPKNLAKVEYQPASMGLLRMKRMPSYAPLFEVSVRNALGLARQFKQLPDIWNSCVDDLSGYSRTLAKKNTSTLSAWKALPPELRAAQPHPLMPAITEMMTKAQEERGFKVIQVSDLAALFELPERTKLTLAQSELVASSVAELGGNIAPNPRFTQLPFGWNQVVALYPREAGDEVPEPHIPAIIRFLYLAVAVASADGSLGEDELVAFNGAISGEITRAADWRHIKATEAALCRDANVAVRSLAHIAGHISPQSKKPVLKTLVHLSAADGTVTLEEQRMLRRIARDFDVEDDFVDACLTETVGSMEVKIAGAKPPGGRGEAIPPQGNAPSFKIDMARVQQLTQETHEVVTLLNEVMAEEEMEVLLLPSVQPSASVVQPETWLGDLDTRYHGPLLILMKYDEVTTERFDHLAKEHHLLSDDLLNSINTWSDQSLGDFLLERTDVVRVFRTLLSVS